MKKRVFTNGCFDLIHPGHIDLLYRAKELGSELVVGINSDASVRSIKGPDRPIQSAEARKAILLALKPVDEVIVFDEQTPERLIKEIKPDILVKGGDWKPAEIVGSDFVIANGGEVFSLRLVEGFSSSSLIDKLIVKPKPDPIQHTNAIARSLEEAGNTLANVVADHMPSIKACSDILIETFKGGNKVLLCGNGGSAADAQHIAAEFVGRYETERIALPSIALTTDTSALTAIANDYSFDRVFARQVESLAAEGDCLVAISTSGNSPNVIAAVMEARKRRCRVIGLTGSEGKKLAALSDACVLVPSKRTARIQEMHITIAHILCEMVDQAFSK